MHTAMCEHCDNPALRKTEREPLAPENPTPSDLDFEEPWGGCEGFDVDEEDDEDPFMPCASVPQWLILDTHPGEHYCEYHKQEYLAHLAEDSPVGADEIEKKMEGTSLLTIKRSEQCEQVMEQGMCDKPATRVFVETWQHQFCPRHASEWDVGPEENERTPTTVGIASD